jgi:hypothetical protein
MAQYREDCSAAEALAFTDAYFAAIDIAREASRLFDTLVTLTTNSTDRSFYRSKALAAQQEYEVLLNARRAFNNGSVSINPPSPADVKVLQVLSAVLGAKQAKIENASAILQLFSAGLDGFKKILA